MRDNAAVNITIPIALKIEMATSHKHRVPISISICGATVLVRELSSRQALILNVRMPLNVSIVG
jgi:hypothetical protein